MRGPPSHARSLGEALERCSRRGRGALQEGGAALAAGVDALSFVLFGCSAEGSALEPFWLLAVEMGDSLGRRPDGDALVGELREALDREIRRWEARGADDPSARLVALAFSELRGLLGILEGVDSTGAAPRSARRGHPRPSRPRGPKAPDSGARSG